MLLLSRSCKEDLEISALQRSMAWAYLAFLLEETARKILPEAVLACCVSGIIHVRCGYYRWGSRDAIRYSDIDAASVCIGSHSAG